MVDIFSPGAWQFWSNTQVRPKRVFEGLLLFSDFMFGGTDANSFPPFMVKSFSRPGYNTIGTQKSEYQLRSGDYAKIDYPTQEFTTAPIEVTLVDANIGSTQGPDTTGHVNAALGMMQKTWNYEETAMATEEGAANKAYQLFIQGYTQGGPRIITILEINNKGDAVGEWSIYQPVLTSATFSKIDYAGTGFGTVSLKFEYKNFKFEQGWSKRELNRRLQAAASGDDRLATKYGDKWRIW